MIKFDKMNNITKNLAQAFGVLSVILFFSCDPDTGVTDNVVDAPPSGSITAPGGSVLANLSLMNEAFTISADLTDGELSPLAGAEFSITDAAGTEVVSSGPIGATGTEATVTFDVLENSIDTGAYTITMKITDTAGLTTDVTSDFEVALSEFAFNYPILYFRGHPNGWAAGEMELVADNTWVIKEQTFVNDTDAFKIANTDDWSDCDWGADSGTPAPHGLTATMVIKCPGAADPNQDYIPGVTGQYNITFNDETFAVEIGPSFASNNDGLWIRGAFNGWDTSNPLSLVADNTWERTDLTIEDGQGFKVANTDDWSDCDYGSEAGGSQDIGLTGSLFEKCQATGDNQDAIFTGGNGTYTFTFNDETFEYSFE